MSEMSPSDVALLSRDEGILGGGGAFFWILALLILAGGGFGGLGGNNGNYVTQADLTNQLNAQTMQGQLQQIALSSANNNYETARLISELSSLMLQQNNTNLINAIQGFNQLGSKIDQLSYHMDQCCCELKTMNLQNRLDDANAALVAANNTIAIGNQSQYLLGQLGRFVAWTPSGTQAAASGT